MKKQLKAAIAAILAVLMALAVFPVSALTRLEAEKSPVTPYWSVPVGYNAHDYTKCVEFLEQTDDDGVKNGEKLSNYYDPNDPDTWGYDEWGADCFIWIHAGEYRICEISVVSADLIGSLDVSDCDALEVLDCSFNNISELDVSGCTALMILYCCSNSLSELDASNNTAIGLLNCGSNNISELAVPNSTDLNSLDCSFNNLSELDVSDCTALWELDCSANNLSILDLSNNTELEYLYCSANNLTEIYLNSIFLSYDAILAEGDGYVGYCCDTSTILLAYPVNNAGFAGFYTTSGALISAGEWDDLFGAYVYEFTDQRSGTAIARFSGSASVPGDADGSGDLSIDDALLILRDLIIGDMIDDEMLELCDVNGDGEVDLLDALLVMRRAMGVINSFPIEG